MSIPLIQNILLSLRYDWSLEDHLANTNPPADDLNSLSRIPFQDRIFAYLRIDCDFKRTVSDVQDLFQSLFHFLPELILLFDLHPCLFLLILIELKISHVRQRDRRQDAND